MKLHEIRTAARLLLDDSQIEHSPADGWMLDALFICVQFQSQANTNLLTEYDREIEKELFARWCSAVRLSDESDADLITLAKEALYGACDIPLSQTASSRSAYRSTLH